MIVYVVAFFASAVIVFLPYFIHDKIQRKQIQHQVKTEPFIVSEYYDRMEKAALDILEHQWPVDQTIILGWGLDGLRLNEDGTLEWVSRKKPKSKETTHAYLNCGTQNTSLEQQISMQMEQMRQQINQPMAQMTAQIDQQINSLRAQNGQSQRKMIQNLCAGAVMSLLPVPGYMGYSPQYQLTQCCVQYPAQYPQYRYAGCCCNFLG